MSHRISTVVGLIAFALALPQRSEAQQGYALVDGNATNTSFTYYGNLGVPVTSLGFSGPLRVDFSTFGLVFGGVANRANVQVTPVGTATGFLHSDRASGGGFCNFTLNSSTPGGVYLRCFKGDGSGQHKRDALVLVLQASPGDLDRLAYAYLEQPTSPSYRVSTRRSFGRGTMQVTRSGVGQYQIDLGTVANPGATVMATAMSPFNYHCNVRNWGGGRVNVRCFNLAGNPVDTAVSVLAVGENYPGASFLWNNNPTTGGTPAALWAHSSDNRTQFVRRTGTGRYTVTLGPEASPGSHIQVSAYGSNAYCSAMPSGSLQEIWRNRQVNVLCAVNGVPTDTRFTVLGIKRMDTLGLGAIATQGSSDPRRPFICPTTVIGDREFGSVFGGNGATVTSRFDVNRVFGDSQVDLTVFFSAIERNGGDTATAATRRVTLGFAPAGMRYGNFLTPAGASLSQIHSFTSNSGAFGEDFRNFTLGTTNIVANLQAVGDTSGTDVSTDSDCTNDTRLQQFRLNPIRIALIPN